MAEMLEAIDSWDDNTPAGLDILKQRLDDFYTPSGRGRALVATIKDKLKGTLNEKVPGYFEMTKDYAKTSGMISEIEDTLSLKQGARTDTTIKKLISALKEDNEFRKALVEKLDNLTQKDLVPSLAGASLNTIMPRGLIGRSLFAGGGIGILSGVVTPKILFGLALTSPRIVGELLSILGMSNKAIQSFMEFVKSPMGKQILQLEFQAGRVTRQESQENSEELNK